MHLYLLEFLSRLPRKPRRIPVGICAVDFLPFLVDIVDFPSVCNSALRIFSSYNSYWIRSGNPAGFQWAFCAVYFLPFLVDFLDFPSV